MTARADPGGHPREGTTSPRACSGRRSTAGRAQARISRPPHRRSARSRTRRRSPAADRHRPTSGCGVLPSCHVPAQHDLSRCDAVDLGEFLQHLLGAAVRCAVRAGSSSRCECRARCGRNAGSPWGKYGCSSTWLTAGVTPVSSMSRVSIASVKFETPIERTSCFSRRSIMARHVSTYLSTLGFGQWMSEQVEVVETATAQRGVRALRRPRHSRGGGRESSW